MNNTKKYKIAFFTLGCKVNSYETEGMKRLFLEAGYDIVEFSDVADILVSNDAKTMEEALEKIHECMHIIDIILLNQWKRW